jgi:hypothetical protein
MAPLITHIGGSATCFQDATLFSSALIEMLRGTRWPGRAPKKPAILDVQGAAPPAARAQSLDPRPADSRDPMRPGFSAPPRPGARRPCPSQNTLRDACALRRIPCATPVPLAEYPARRPCPSQNTLRDARAPRRIPCATLRVDRRTGCALCLVIPRRGRRSSAGQAQPA